MPLPLTVSCFSKIQIGFTFLVPADPGSPRQRAVNVCVCVCVCHVEIKTFGGLLGFIGRHVSNDLAHARPPDQTDKTLCDLKSLLT